MAYCGKCGTKMEDNTKFCPACGAANEPVPAYGTPPTNGAVSTDADALAGKGMGILSYITILVLVPVFAGGNNQFVRFHANQGLVLFICEVIVSVIASVLRWILPFGFLWRIVNWGAGLFSLGFFVLAVIGILNVVNGQAKELPLIGTVKILK